MVQRGWLRHTDGHMYPTWVLAHGPIPEDYFQANNTRSRTVTPPPSKEQEELHTNLLKWWTRVYRDLMHQFRELRASIAALVPIEARSLGQPLPTSKPTPNQLR